MTHPTSRVLIAAASVLESCRDLIPHPVCQRSGVQQPHQIILLLDPADPITSINTVEAVADRYGVPVRTSQLPTCIAATYTQMPVGTVTVTVAVELQARRGSDGLPIIITSDNMWRPFEGLVGRERPPSGCQWATAASRRAELAVALEHVRATAGDATLHVTADRDSDDAQAVTP